MKRRDLIQKVIFAGTSILLMPSVFQSCSKDEKEEDAADKTFTIDLTDSKFTPLNSVGGIVVVAVGTKSIIVSHTEFSSMPYLAADSKCTADGITLEYGWNVSGFWLCPSCHTEYDYDGKIITGTATVPLKVYPVTKSQNILTLHNL